MIYTRREFIEKCGQQWDDSSRAKIAMWVKRGNLVETAEGKIDDANEINKDWLLKKVKPLNEPVSRLSPPPSEGPQCEIDFWQFIEKESDYPAKNEKKLADLMKYFASTGTQFQVLPVALVKHLLIGQLVDLAQALLDRELSIKERSGMPINPARLLNFYKGTINKRIEIFQSEAEMLVNEIIQEN